MEIKAKIDLGEELTTYIDNQIDMKIHKKFETLIGVDNYIPKSEVALTKDELRELLRPLDFEDHLRKQFPQHIITTSSTESLDILLKKLHEKLD